MSVLDDVIKTYDLRGLVGSQLNPELMKALGSAFAEFVSGDQILIGHDMRPSSPEFAEAFAEGVNANHKKVLLLGLCSTDQTYFASGKLNLPAVMFTASHNPASYNGIKFSNAGAQGISFDTGLAEIKKLAEGYLENPLAISPRDVEEYDSLGDYADYLKTLVKIPKNNMRVVVDAANGMGGHTVPAALSELDIDPMYFQLDGTFPNHEANPLDPKNLVDLQERVLETKADLGIAFDGDADRCFIIDENAEPVNPSAIASIVAKREVERVGGEPYVLHNLLTSRFFAEYLQKLGAKTVRTKVGHSLIKDEMRRTQAVFGGEHSAHYYFRDFWGADNGMLAAMHVLAELAETGKTMSELAADLNPYFLSGEINSQVADVSKTTNEVIESFSEAEVEWFDGVTLSFEGERWWWLNLRPSNTEPLLRLNVEAYDEQTMRQIRDKALSIIRGDLGNN
ncbi:MAG TPA: phosphomannomutase/phosphoglucomutase [Microbacteriaceae bacterium]